MERYYIVNYSRLQKMFMLLNASSKIIVALSPDFTGIYKAIKKIQSTEDIELTFTDTCIDEMQRRKLYVEGVC